MTSIWSFQCMDCHQEYTGTLQELTQKLSDKQGNDRCECGSYRWLCRIIGTKAEEIPVTTHQDTQQPMSTPPVVKSANRGRPRYAKGLVEDLIGQGKSSRVISAELRAQGINVSFRTIARRMNERKQGVLL